MSADAVVTNATITMVGYTGTGKTSYLYGMYRQMQFGHEHFTLRTTDPDDSKILEDRWAKIAEGGEDRWPLPTEEKIQQYDLELDYGHEPLESLRWIDYDGGRIARSQKLQDVQELMNWLEQSTCVFLTVPGEYLSHPLSVVEATEKIQVQRMNELMGHLVRHIHPNHEKPLPVAIVVTKYDLCMASGRDPAEIVADVKALFDPLFAKRHRLLFRSPSYLTAICPVTLGVDLANDSVRGTAGPKFTQDPVLFATWATLWQRKREAEASGASADQIADMQGKLELLSESLKTVPLYLEGEKFDVRAATGSADKQRQ